MKPYVSFIDPKGLRGARVGVLKEAWDFKLPYVDPEVVKLAQNAIKVFGDNGAEVFDPVSLNLDLVNYLRANTFPSKYEANQLSPLTGLPAFIVPMGFTPEGLPVGLEILGRPWSEPTLIKLASGFETVTHNRRVPATTPPLPGETIKY